MQHALTTARQHFVPFVFGQTELVGDTVGDDRYACLASGGLAQHWQHQRLVIGYRQQVRSIHNFATRTSRTWHAMSQICTRKSPYLLMEGLKS